MTRFEEALLTELTTLVDTAAPSPRRARRRPRPALVAAGVGAATVLAAGLVLGPGGQTPGYALERQADGTFRLAVHQVSGVEEANEALDAAGIRARVYALGPSGSCPEFRLGDRPDDPPHLTNIGAADADWFYLPRDVPPDVTLVLTVHPRDDGTDDSLTVTSSAIRGDAPPCVEPGPDPATAPQR
jgi:hypothetical protein